MLLNAYCISLSLFTYVLIIDIFSHSENKSDHFLNSYDYNRTTNLSQYNEDIKFKKSNEIDSRTYTRRKHSRSNDQDGKSIGF